MEERKNLEIRKKLTIIVGGVQVHEGTFIGTKDGKYTNVQGNLLPEGLWSMTLNEAEERARRKIQQKYGRQGITGYVMDVIFGKPYTIQQ